MEVTLTTTSPVHVGTGDELRTQEYVFEGGQAYRPNLDRYFREHEEEIPAFVEDMEQGRSLGQTLTQPHQYARYDLDLWVKKHAIGRTPISPFIKTRGEEPYLPGSSIKGALRTALATYAVETAPTPQPLSGDTVEGLFTLSEEGSSMPQPRQDIMRCLSVSDASLEPSTETPLILSEVKTYSRKRSGMEPKHWSAYLECLRPETTLTADLRIDVDLLTKMEAEYGYGDVIDAVFGPERTEQAILNRLQTAVSSTSEALVQRARMLTDEFPEIEAFYDGFSSDEIPLRLGFGTGWDANTVGPALSDSERVSVTVDNRLGKPLRHANCGGVLVDDDHGQDVLFCTDCYTGGIAPGSDAVEGTFPKTRRFALKDGGPAYPLGWLSIEL